MYLKNLLPSTDTPWSVLAICDNRATCQVDEFLSTLPPNISKDGTAMRRLLMYVAQHGPQQLPVEISHTVADDIFQFTKGRIRVLWFYDGGKMVICCHAFPKKGQKTPTSIIDSATAYLRAYRLARSKNHTKILEGT